MGRCRQRWVLEGGTGTGWGWGRGELVLRAAGEGVNGEVLHRLQVKLNARDGGGFVAQAIEDGGERGRALAEGLEVDQDPAVVEGRVGAIDADEARNAGHIGIRQKPRR